MVLLSLVVFEAIANAGKGSIKAFAARFCQSEQDGQVGLNKRVSLIPQTDL